MPSPFKQAIAPFYALAQLIGAAFVRFAESFFCESLHNYAASFKSIREDFTTTNYSMVGVGT